MDYYPFGMLVPKHYHEDDDNYRYGYQGQEKDNEIRGAGNSLNYTFRMHDPRVGRFFATDPLMKSYPWNSPFAFSENRVIESVELEGLERGRSRYNGCLAQIQEPAIKSITYDDIIGGIKKSSRTR
ncbi:RHS repeat-associated core domain-containing protein [Flavobacterium sp. 3HN19-14]|uniref:RHS repeat-associated core domain-containing protein n=1 Tax=Flavobacterium sp. 3HN19-14 TaxID=3448133 RepID=UPI003EDFC228